MMMRFRPLVKSLARRGHAHAKLSSLSPLVGGGVAPRAAVVAGHNNNNNRTAPFSTRKDASTAVESDLQQKLLQRLCWEAYLGSGRGSTTLFQSIDANSTGYISREDLIVFLSSIEGKGVNPKAFQILDVLADDHRIDLREFKSWLIIATKFGSKDKNSSYKASLDEHPELGERQKSEYEDEYSWNEVTMAQSLRRMQYAVRGEVVMKADKLQAAGREILFTNIGNPHSVGQQPLTYFRQVLALCDLPAADGVDHPEISKIFPADVIARAREIRQAIGPAGTGAYTNSQGILQFRKNVANFIQERDGGHPAYAGNVFLTNGASAAIEMILTGLIEDDHSGIMIPIPQYPIYSALIARLGGRQIGYLLDESIGWAVTEEELRNKLYESQQKGVHVKALAIINPGNPTGQVLSRKDLEVICKFCAKNEIVLLADEVYQRNVYVDDKEFISAKKIAVETPGCEKLQLVSFHSTSKGLIGECGRRGGYMELHNICPYVQSQIYKLASSGLCSCVTGQVMTNLMITPPKSGEESYEQFAAEEGAIMNRLKSNALALVKGLNEVDGIDCVRAEGAMYAFPRVSLPQKALDEAEAQEMTPDTLYALSLLEETGICVVPASGFGQEEGRVGFRTTFLPPEDKIEKAIGEFKRHHELFCQKYA